MLANPIRIELVQKCERMTPDEVRQLRHGDRTTKGEALLAVWNAGFIDNGGLWCEGPNENT